MICCVSGQEIPTDKLFVLYYPPSLAHADWDKSVYAAIRAREALQQTVTRLQKIYWRHVVGRKLFFGLAIGLMGLLLLAGWLDTLTTAWAAAGWFQRYFQFALALVLLWFARRSIRAFLRRFRLWNSKGKTTVAQELRAIQEEISKMPPDPPAEQAAVAMRRECPAVLSELAFEGTYFRAFTYLDFVLYPELKHPVSREELPDKHRLSRDAYYVGDIVYDGWRMFRRDQRELSDPRFVGSGGRRGVL